MTDVGTGFDWSSFLTIFLTILLSSGVVAGVVGALLGNFFDKKARARAEVVDMARFRMEKISNRLKDYIPCLQFCGWLSYSLRQSLDKPSTRDDRISLIILFYFYIGFLQTVRRTILLGDGLALADQNAETVIAELYNTAKMSLQIFDLVTEAKVRQLIEENESLNDLESVIDNDYDVEGRNFFSQFVNWVYDPRHSQQVRIAHAALRCLSELLKYEINYTFEKWYNRKFTTEELISPCARNFLYNEPLFENLKLVDWLNDYFRKLFEDRLR